MNETNKIIDSFAKKLSENCEDSAVVIEIMKDFDRLNDEQKKGIVLFLIGSLSMSRQKFEGIEKKKMGGLTK